MRARRQRWSAVRYGAPAPPVALAPPDPPVASLPPLLAPAPSPPVPAAEVPPAFSSLAPPAVAPLAPAPPVGGARFSFFARGFGFGFAGGLGLGGRGRRGRARLGGLRFRARVGWRNDVGRAFRRRIRHVAGAAARARIHRACGQRECHEDRCGHTQTAATGSADARERAHAYGAGSPSGAMRRPQVGQSFRSFCAS